jgi:hypothetical protein
MRTMRTCALAVQQPARALEAFFREMGKMPEQRSKEHVDGLFKAYAMTVVGEPLKA